MAKTIVINPVTRISGFLETDAQIKDNFVTDARTKGLLFRGFEKILKGRSPFDAIYFTQRICGICSTAHSMASSIALEDALDIVPSEQGRYLRDIVHGCEFLQNHIRHFYQYAIPDFIKLPEKYSLFEVCQTDFRLPEQMNDMIVSHYFESLGISRTSHEMLAVLGGKVPHNHGVFIGGVATQATADKIIGMKSLLESITRFVNDKMVPDVHILAHYYDDYFHVGRGYGNLLSYGCFDGYRDLGTLYVDPLVYTDGTTDIFDPGEITEEINHSWYTDKTGACESPDIVPEADMFKKGAYSWIKAARYNGLPYEVGPLARQWLSGEYRHGISVMDRTIARVLETQKIAGIIDILLNNLIPGYTMQKEYTIPDTAEGKGLIDTTRGALGHWLKIMGGLISFYQVITPSVWNLSSKGDNGTRGTVEQALVGTFVCDPGNPVELGRIIRSFDPCISCATHVYDNGKHIGTIQVIP